MKLLLVSLYVLVALYLSAAWLRFLKKGAGLSPQQKVLSFLTVGIATVFWPLVLPIAYVKLLDTTVSQP
ncbi:MAG: hypothetical protein RIM23_22345 [Coleofasciculus sp. G3-WIS-01]|uniref:hypothetical protein n=1 Tax=Coleofasciculus sp. G3-WIS-01 TaxID=3069528 RepID=UPI0032FA3AF1